RVNLKGLAHSVIDALEPILRDREANTEIVGEAPDVLGNPDRLKQAVTNLVENASRFIDPGGHITIELFGRRGNSILAVKDDGPGFGDADPKLLFDRFYRADASRSRGPGGTGLGLAIVKSVVEAHDGTVEAINLPEG
ncbi:ATP-binding protein, partial [Alistipes onderdonkii]|nr:ATP-binding protein [Alistipes onderdonkii]